MGINVLSLFDGMSCGLVALKRAGIQVDNYFASEIDKYAIQIAKKNHPEIIHLGDVQNWQSWDLPKIDLLIGGSPCQGFSNAGEGKNFDDPRSRLFYTYVDIRNELYALNNRLQFLLENVKMKQQWQDIITENMGVCPVEINSSLVSAQNRKRLYWANWKIEQPEDKGLILADVLEDSVEDRYLGGYNPTYKTQSNSLHNLDGKSNVLCANTHGYANGYIPIRTKSLMFVAGLEEGRRLDDGKNLSRNYREGYRIYSSLGKAATLSAMPKGGEGGYTGLYQVGIASDVNGLDINKRIYSSGGKSPTLSTMQGGHREPKVAIDDLHYRKLTPLECERLQTLPDGYTEGVSNTQRYKMIGNGWTVDVISHILKSNPILI